MTIVPYFLPSHAARQPEKKQQPALPRSGTLPSATPKPATLHTAADATHSRNTEVSGEFEEMVAQKIAGKSKSGTGQSHTRLGSTGREWETACYVSATAPFRAPKRASESSLHGHSIKRMHAAGKMMRGAARPPVVLRNCTNTRQTDASGSRQRAVCSETSARTSESSLSASLQCGKRRNGAKHGRSGMSMRGTNGRQGCGGVQAMLGRHRGRLKAGKCCTQVQHGEGQLCSGCAYHLPGSWPEWAVNPSRRILQGSKRSEMPLEAFLVSLPARVFGALKVGVFGGVCARHCVNFATQCV